MDKVFDYEFLKSRRKECNVSQETLSKALGFKNSSTYSKYENGDTPLKVNMLLIISSELKSPISSFFTRKSSKIEHKKHSKEVS